MTHTLKIVFSLYPAVDQENNGNGVQKVAQAIQKKRAGGESFSSHVFFPRFCTSPSPPKKGSRTGALGRQEWPFFRSMLDLIDVELGKASPQITEHYESKTRLGLVLGSGVTPIDIRPF